MTGDPVLEGETPMNGSDWSTLRPQPGMPEWTVVTSRPALAERLAIRSYQFNLRMPRPWWAFVIAPGLCFVGLGLRAWVNGELSVILLLLLFLTLMAIWAWERQGLLDLIGRYDAELRHLTSVDRRSP
jgi:hypothetical protein